MLLCVASVFVSAECQFETHSSFIYNAVFNISCHAPLKDGGSEASAPAAYIAVYQASPPSMQG